MPEDYYCYFYKKSFYLISLLLDNNGKDIGRVVVKFDPKIHKKISKRYYSLTYHHGIDATSDNEKNEIEFN